MREFTALETEEQIEKLGIESSLFEGFAVGGRHAPVSYAWHQHSRHQLQYAFEGAVAVEAEGRRFLVPPQRAIWITAGVRHRTIAGLAALGRKPVYRAYTISIFFSPALVESASVSVFNCGPLLREMIGYSLRWGPVRTPTLGSIAFFRAMALLCAEWIREPSHFWLPDAKDPRIGAALHWVEANLRDADENTAARVAGMSPRTFRRHFVDSTGLAWRDYISRARILHSADSLTGSDEAIAEIGWRTGYDSPSAFAKAFFAFTGETPAQYRRQSKTGGC